MEIQATVAVQGRNVVGECPVWDARQQRLLWLDQLAGTIHEARSDGAGGWLQSRQWQLTPPLAALVPRRRGGFVVIAATEILLFDDATGKSARFAAFDIDPALSRMNDAKCDAQGRLWVGSMSSDFSTPRASLYRIDPGGNVTEILEGLRVGNGLGWSPDGATFYFADSMQFCVYAFDFDAARGTLDNRRAVVTFEKGTAPDGLCVDREGCLWIAAPPTGEVQRYSPQGELLARVRVATPGVTSCAFGGADGSELFMTSISVQMPAVVPDVPPEMLANNRPESGSLFVCRPGVSGAPSTPFAG